MDKIVGKLKHEAIKLKREAKRAAEMESSLERNLREATSDKHYGCPNSVLYEIALSAFNFHDRYKIMSKVREKLQSTADRWCRILKTLTLVEFLVKNGPNEVVAEVRCELPMIRRFLHFSYYTGGQEKGGAVVEKAKTVVNLFSDEEVLRTEREKAHEHRQKMVNAASTYGGGGGKSSHARSKPQSQHLSKAKFDQRFNELKEKREQDRASREEHTNPEVRGDDSRTDNGGGDQGADGRDSSSSEDDVGRKDESGDRRQGKTDGLDIFDTDAGQPISSAAQSVDLVDSKPVPAAQVDLLDMFDDAVAPSTSGSVSACPPGQEVWAAFDEAPAAPVRVAPVQEAWGAFDAAPAAPVSTAPVQEAWAAFDAAPAAPVPVAPVQEAWGAFDAAPAAPVYTAPVQDAWAASDVAPGAPVPTPPVQASKDSLACVSNNILDLSF
eukprot:TRINITY_DN4497_c0_g2_i1.p1 TRINITY_DN4497_c0_g2~~TRINITY_DN4497_c0_g2_i1.p1  ORF type:complete len:439 (-),score=76.37 TRINITY_DN4497_c0_g2_i1:78-1394(-)